jgi:TonB-linked SusC/RagA family outer membrane protein
MKKNCKGIPLPKFNLKLSHQKILTMKVSLLLFILATFHVSASLSQSSKMDLNVSDKSLSDVIKTIETQSGYRFFYSDNYRELNDLVSLRIENASIHEVLSSLLHEKSLSFKVISDNVVIIGPSKAFQQQRISGTITDASTGEAIVGANSVIEGTTSGTITDVDGKFSITVPAPGSVLVVSFLGYNTERITVNTEAELTIKLIPDITDLDEVVVVGYGTVKKKDLTGAVSSVQGDAISARQTTTVSQALQGAMSGVLVTRSHNAPGSSATIRIRGITSIGENNPLVIVDGVPVDNINDINPNDVENISVLKDAASASIYGSRAASGVVLITTKRAKSGAIGLQYNMEYGFEKPTAIPEYVNVNRYMQMANELRWNDNNNNANEYPIYPKDVIDNYASLHAENPNKYPDTDWVGLVLKENAPRQSHVLSLTAGTKAVRSKMSLAYDKLGALYEGRNYERITARFNNDVDITKYLSASIDFSFKRSMEHLPSIDPIYPTFISAPVYAATWADGRIADGKTGHNIYAQLLHGGNVENHYNQVGGKISLDFTPFKGFKFSAVVSPSLGFDKMKNFQKKVSYYSADDPAVYVGTTQWGSSTNLNEKRNDYSRVTSQLIANYMKEIGAHSLNFMAGYENFNAFNENLGAFRDKYELTNFPFLNLGPLEFRDNSGNAWENAYRSYFGRVMYNFKNKYFVQGNIRYDGSSRFHQDYRWGSFPSFSVGWVLSEENFMKNIPTLSFLKLRGSWGSLGNERIGSNYPYQATIAFTNALFFQGSNVVAAQTAAQTKYVIQDISWETTESLDFGVDANFFNNRLKLTGDYFQKTTRDMLLALEIPDYIGFDNPDQNTGKMSTKGWEAEIGWNDQVGQVNYSISANISDFKSIMGDLGGTQFLGDQIKKEGSEFNEWYGYVSDGLFQTDEDLAASPKLNTAVKVGDVKYRDISGADVVPDGKFYPENDRKVLGGSLPRYLDAANEMLGSDELDL